MRCFAEPFEQAKQHWNLEKLERDLTEVKQQGCGKRKKITPVELACLRGLLCGCSPTEIAAKLKREPRGLRVDLSRGLYRYVEVLAQREPNELKDWRDVADWLRDYKIRSGSTSDSPIKIVDITLGGSSHIPLLDVKLRNIGQQVAFLKKARFQFYQTWILYSWVAEGKERETDRLSATLERTYAFSASRSRAVEPSFDYEINLHSLFESHQECHCVEKERSNSSLVAEEFNISQCVDGNDVDRFTLSLIFPEESAMPWELGYLTQIYHLKLEIVYDEDDKVAESQNLILGIEPETVPPLRDRFFFDTSHQCNPKPLKPYSAQNRKMVKAIAKIEGLQNSIVKQICSLYETRCDRNKLLLDTRFDRPH